jgi:hypothetical protein
MHDRTPAGSEARERAVAHESAGVWHQPRSLPFNRLRRSLPPCSTLSSL